jgi:hypothetical protein
MFWRKTDFKYSEFSFNPSNIVTFPRKPNGKVQLPFFTLRSPDSPVSLFRPKKYSTALRKPLKLYLIYHI